MNKKSIRNTVRHWAVIAAIMVGCTAFLAFCGWLCVLRMNNWYGFNIPEPVGVVGGALLFWAYFALAYWAEKEGHFHRRKRW